ncbi:MAG: fructose-6-phosphate aldolase [Bdellovibrionaceae bacterium]|nr:fructose-6-phosphate aldolase [Pseudobdellovibrionaceae bacterium]
MKFFIDSADIKEIQHANERGWVDGVTTNPTLVSKMGRPMKEIIKEICGVVSGPVSAEVLSTSAADMYKEGLELAKISDNVVVKLPMTEDGLVVVRKYKAEGIKTNVTLVFSPLQALLVAKAGGTMVSPFVGRLDDISTPGMELIHQIKTIFMNYAFETEILVASVRHNVHILDSAMLGADIVTVPFKVMQGMLQHPLTDKGLETFLKDSQKIVK